MPRTPGNVPHTMRAGPKGARVLDIFSPPRAEYKKAGKGLGKLTCPIKASQFGSVGHQASRH